MFVLSEWKLIDATVKGEERELEGGDPGGVTLGSERWRMNGEADSPTDLEMTAPKNQGENRHVDNARHFSTEDPGLQNKFKNLVPPSLVSSDST